MTSLKTLIHLEIETGNLDDILSCPWRIRGGQMCPMIYYKKEAKWIEIPLDEISPEKRLQMMTRSCPVHLYLESKRYKMAKAMKNYLERRTGI